MNTNIWMKKKDITLEKLNFNDNVLDIIKPFISSRIYNGDKEIWNCSNNG